MKNTIVVNGKRKVCRIYDTGPDGAFDRYTIAFKGYHVSDYGMVYPYLASSDNPFHPQGFGMRCESRDFLKGEHLGQRISFDALPEQVQDFVLQSI